MNNFEIEEMQNIKIQDIIYFTKNGDTLSSLSQKFNVDEKSIAIDNDLDENSFLSEGDILWIRKANHATYIVKPLDTIEKIAQKFNVSSQHIKQLNNISTVYIGQKIYI